MRRFFASLHRRRGNSTPDNSASNPCVASVICDRVSSTRGHTTPAPNPDRTRSLNPAESRRRYSPDAYPLGGTARHFVARRRTLPDPRRRPDAPVSMSGDGLAPHLLPPSACVPAPSSGGCRLRSHGGSQWPDGFPDPSGVSMGCGLLWFSGQLSDECGPGHQIECGIFQYWDVGGRHMAPKHQFGARGQCLGRHGQQLNGVESSRHRKLPQTH